MNHKPKGKVQKREPQKITYDITDIIQYRNGDFHIVEKEFFYLS